MADQESKAPVTGYVPPSIVVLGSVNDLTRGGSSPDGFVIHHWTLSGVVSIGGTHHPTQVTRSPKEIGAKVTLAD
jgi:hypothetical protein